MAYQHSLSHPHYRRKPDPHLQHDIDDLRQVPEEDHDGTSGIGEPQNQREHTESIVDQLQIVDIRESTVSCVQ